MLLFQCVQINKVNYELKGEIMGNTMKFIQKNFLLLIILLILMSLSIFSMYKFNSIRPIHNITGFYQEENPSSPFYEFNFWDNRFQAKKDGKKLDEGIFEQYDEITYILSGQSESILITLLNDGFYYYDEINKEPIFLIKKYYVPVNLQ